MVAAIVRSIVVTGVVLGGACLQTRPKCANGRVCPETTVCDEVHHTCVLPDQLTTCAGVADGVACIVGGQGDGTCLDEVCVRAGCGDGVRREPEECDGDDWGLVEDCRDRGFHEPAALRCADDCTFDELDCGTYCGDALVNGDEQCDPFDDTDDTSCQDLGYYDDVDARCALSCGYDVSICTGYCGDDLVNGGETCDGSADAGKDCVELGFDAGRAACNAFCLPDATGCGRFGWTPVSIASGASFNAIWSTAPDDAWAVGSSANVAHWDGDGWEVTPVQGNSYGGRAVWASSSSDVWRVGGHVGCHFDGTGWSCAQIAVGGTVDGVWGSGPTDVWAVGQQGQILHHDGSGWSTSSSGTLADLSAVWGSGATDVYAVGSAGTMLHWDGGGWSPVSTPATGELSAIHGTAADDIHVVAGNDLLHWDGAAWQSTAAPIPGLKAITAGARDDVIAVGAAGAIARWDGTGWTAMRGSTGLSLNGVSGTGSSRFAVGDSGILLQWQGREWTPMTQPSVSGAPNGAVWGSGSGTVHASGQFGRVFYWDGTAWTVSFLPVGADQRAMWGWGEDVYSTGENGFVLERSVPEWIEHSPSPSAIELFAMWGPGPDDVHVVGYDGQIAHRSAAGWADVASPTTQHLRGLWGVAPDDVYAVGEAGTILHHDGTSWTAMTSPTTQHLRAAWASGPGDVFAVGDAGTILHHDGTGWVVMPTPVTTRLEAVWGNAADDVFAVGATATVLHHDGVEWTRVRPPPIDDIMAAWGTGRDLFILGNLGEVSRLVRTRPWSCRAAESACADGSDDDCDGAVDADDPDCAGALVLSEVFVGTESYVEVENRSPRAQSLSGFHVSWLINYYLADVPFPVDAVLAPGAVFRLTSDRSPQARERHDRRIEDGTITGGWVALCVGSCDAGSCRNMHDYVALSDEGLGGGLEPGCASFAGGALDLTSGTADQGATRTAYSGGGAHGQLTDWVVANRSRD